MRRFRDHRWLHGGCLAFAEALRRRVGGTLHDVITGGGVVNHVVVRVGRLYHDAERAYGRKELLAAWGIAGADLLPHCKERCRDWNVTASAKEIAEAAGAADRVARERGLRRVKRLP